MGEDSININKEIGIGCEFNDDDGDDDDENGGFQITSNCSCLGSGNFKKYLKTRYDNCFLLAYSFRGRQQLLPVIFICSWY